jgi:sulfate/thiosulfate transport system permease protein
VTVPVSIPDTGAAPGRAVATGRGRRAPWRRDTSEGPPSTLVRAGETAAKVGGPALAVTYLSLLVLLPVAALISNAFSGGWSEFWSAVTQPEAVAALELTLVASLIVASVNSIAGLAIAWVLVRDDFRGKALVSAIIDLPFALPTIVAGLTLLTLYGPTSPFHVNLADTRIGIGAALLFVTLPFCVRSVQPVLAELDRETEEAADSLGASRGQVLRKVILPSLLPSVLAGAGLAFARAIGEFGSVVLISGNIPFKTEVASSWIYSLTQSDDLPAASAVSIVLILIALAVLIVIGSARRRFDVPETV